MHELYILKEVAEQQLLPAGYKLPGDQLGCRSRREAALSLCSSTAEPVDG